LNQRASVIPFSHLLHLAVTERNHGLCLFCRCPRCEAPRGYRLVRTRANLSFLGLEFTRPAISVALRCTACGFEIRVELSEEPLLVQNAEPTRLLRLGAISAEAYQDKVRLLPARLLKSLKSLTECWQCAGCGEENPMTFDSCWNCHQEKQPPTADSGTEGQPSVAPPPGGSPRGTM